MSARTGCKLLQLVFLYPEDPFIAAHPEVPMVILENLENTVIEQPFGRRIPDELPILEPVQSSSVRPDPENPVPVRVDGTDVVVRKTMIGRERAECSLKISRQAADRADPERPCGIFRDHPDIVVRDAVRGPVDRNGVAPDPVQTAPGSNPHGPSPVLINGKDDIVGESVRFGIPQQLVAGRGVQSPSP